MRAKLIQVIPAPQGSFFIDGVNIYSVGYITFWEYNGKHYDVPMWYGELSDYAMEKDDLFLMKAILDDNRQLRQCLTKEDIAHIMTLKEYSPDLLAEYQSDVFKGIIRCTPQLLRWFLSDSYDIDNCEDDGCSSSE